MQPVEATLAFCTVHKNRFLSKLLFLGEGREQPRKSFFRRWPGGDPATEAKTLNPIDPFKR